MEKKYKINQETHLVSHLKKDRDAVSFNLEGKAFEISLTAKDETSMTLGIEGKNYRVHYKDGYCRLGGKQYFVEKELLKRGGAQSDDVGSLKSPMPGKILKLFVSEGDVVAKGTTLLVMEAMKMEHSLKAPCDCTVDQFLFKEGELVEGDIELVSITAQSESPS
jgi:3-methylcrotonyl-CoA carboxylase alpha subunit